MGITDTVVTDAGTDTGGGAMPEAGGGDAAPAGTDAEAEAANPLGAPDVDVDAEGGSALVETGADAVTSPPHDAPAEAPLGDGSAGVDAREGGGDASQPPADATPDQASMDSGGCAATTTRCGATGREICDTNQWKSSPCPTSTPTCSSGQCTLRGPTMVQVGGGFYIDSTEVTVAQYQQFLTAKGTDTSGQPSVCAWNTAYKDPNTPLNPGTWPMTSVDWCDALAYCTWAGKHLCGKIGGGPIPVAQVLTANASQWFLACGGPGGASHPNTNATCNSSGGFRTLAPVATYPKCEGFYPGIFDMEGNAAEWVDSCDTTAGANDTCHLLGGSYIDNQSYCTESFDYPRNTIADPFGFRCCGG